MQCIQNLGLAVATMVAPVIVERVGYLVLEMCSIESLFISLLAGVMFLCLPYSKLKKKHFGSKRPPSFIVGVCPFVEGLVRIYSM